MPDDPSDPSNLVPPAWLDGFTNDTPHVDVYEASQRTRPSSIAEIISRQSDLSKLILEQSDLSKLLFEPSELSKVLQEQSDLSKLLLEQSELSNVLQEQLDLSARVLEESDLSKMFNKQSDLSKLVLEQSTLSKLVWEPPDWTKFMLTPPAFQELAESINRQSRTLYGQIFEGFERLDQPIRVSIIDSFQQDILGKSSDLLAEFTRGPAFDALGLNIEQFSTPNGFAWPEAAAAAAATATYIAEPERPRAAALVREEVTVALRLPGARRRRTLLRWWAALSPEAKIGVVGAVLAALGSVAQFGQDARREVEAASAARATAVYQAAMLKRADEGLKLLRDAEASRSTSHAKAAPSPHKRPRARKRKRK